MGDSGWFIKWFHCAYKLYIHNNVRTSRMLSIDSPSKNDGVSSLMSWITMKSVRLGGFSLNVVSSTSIVS